MSRHAALADSEIAPISEKLAQSLDGFAHANEDISGLWFASNHPDVLESFSARVSASHNARDAARGFLESLNLGDSAQLITRSFSDRFTVVALEAPEKPHGWKNSDRNDGTFVPRKSNPEVLHRFNALTFDLPDIVDLQYMHLDGDVFRTPLVFNVDGFVYAHFTTEVVVHSRGTWGVISQDQSDMALELLNY